MNDNITAVLIVFICVIGPIWIVFHYRTKSRAGQQLNAEDAAAFEQLSQVAARMETRIATLERILDTEAPGWRYTAGMGGQPRDRMG